MCRKQLPANILLAFRHNLIPGLVPWCVAVTTGLAYYFFPPAGPAFTWIGGLKAQYGIAYAVCATALFGGVIPFSYLYLTGQIRQNPLKELLFYAIFWGVKGAEVDLFYRLQGVLFGTGNDFHTVAIKTLVDQLFYAPFWVVPSISIFYLWKESGFSWRRCRTYLNRRFVTLTIPTIVISNFLVWLPAVTIIYLMPPNLQIPLFNLVQCFFALVLNMLSRRAE